MKMHFTSCSNRCHPPKSPIRKSSGKSWRNYLIVKWRWCKCATFCITRRGKMLLIKSEQKVGAGWLSLFSLNSTNYSWTVWIRKITRKITQHHLKAERAIMPEEWSILPLEAAIAQTIFRPTPPFFSSRV